MATVKRPRTSTSSKSEGDSDGKVGPASPKAKRTSISASSAVSCSLPPTCNPPNQPSVLANAREFEQHYATCHTHICTAPEVKRHATSSRESQCGMVFPDARFLDLHLSECHDPLAAVRQERGERTLTCFVESCSGRFSTPKGRRLHLIDVHQYPKEYYFAVTTKGVGGIINKWGQGASLLRKEWKPREPVPKAADAMEVEESGTSDGGSPKTARMSSDMVSPPTSPDATRSSPPLSPSARTNPKPKRNTSNDLDDLASGLSSLSLVPPSIRFGRGGKAGGLVGRGSRGHPKPASIGNGGSEPPKSPTRVLGSGKRPSRGRGVGHGFAVVGQSEAEDKPEAKMTS